MKIELPQHRYKYLPYYVLMNGTYCKKIIELDKEELEIYGDVLPREYGIGELAYFREKSLYETRNFYPLYYSAYNDLPVTIIDKSVDENGRTITYSIKLYEDTILSGFFPTEFKANE